MSGNKNAGKLTVKVPDDKTQAANKFLQEQVKTALGCFASSTIDIINCVDMVETALLQYCRMTHRVADLEMWERQQDMMEEGTEEENEDFIDSVHTQPRFDD